MTKTTTDIEKFQYDHIFNLILDMIKFNEKKYGNLVKDTIKILLEFNEVITNYNVIFITSSYFYSFIK